MNLKLPNVLIKYVSGKEEQYTFDESSLEQFKNWLEDDARRGMYKVIIYPHVYFINKDNIASVTIL